MNHAIAVCTTFPDNAFDVYGKRMLESFVQYWPEEVAILVQLDTGKLGESVNGIIRPHDGLKCGWEKDHSAFVERNKDKDSKDDYRKQAVRFCHKVFAIKYALQSVNKAKASGEVDVPRYLIWLDADVLTTRKVTMDDLIKCLPKEGDAVSYLGRKDWPHSECGWLAFDLDNDGDRLIKTMFDHYRLDEIFKQEQWHDSWIYDYIMNKLGTTPHGDIGFKATNLTPNAIGMEVWPQSPMALWSRHYKGPIAKNELIDEKPKKKVSNNMQPLRIETCNSLPNDNLHRNIIENQTQIKNWVLPCKQTEDEIVVVSAGPMLVADDLHDEIAAGRKIVAVKHAIKPLKEAGIKPWACILLDPRDHVYDFVENPDKDIIWFVSSQVIPKAVKSLLDAGCNVWGYHASVGAEEGKFTEKQPHSIVHGGSATATRGLFLLEKLGFYKFRLYGYDLCLSEKPDLSERDERGQPRNFEIAMGYKLPNYKDTRWFWSKGELLAQADEFRQIISTQKHWQIKAFGNGIVPFLTNIVRVNDLRTKAKLSKLDKIKPVHFEDMLGCRTKTKLLTQWHNMLRKVRLKRTKVSNY